MDSKQQTQAVPVDEVASAMGVSKNAIYAAAASGSLPFPVYRVGRRYVIPRAPFERVMKGEAAIERAA